MDAERQDNSGAYGAQLLVHKVYIVLITVVRVSGLTKVFVQSCQLTTDSSLAHAFPRLIRVNTSI